jgi:hypothetical protein
MGLGIKDVIETDLVSERDGVRPARRSPADEVQKGTSSSVNEAMGDMCWVCSNRSSRWS